MKNLFKKLFLLTTLAAVLLFATGVGAVSTLQVQQGGTGVNSISGIVKGNGASPLSTATPGTDYQTPVTVNAADYNGIDMGAKINAAYLACPSGGCQITVPAGNYSYTTPIVFGTNNKMVDLFCPSGGGASNNANGGTTLTYSPSTGNAITVNTNNYVVGGSGIDNCVIQGTNGTSARTTKGILLGGTNGAFSFRLNSVTVAGFGTGVDLFQNTSFITINDSALHFNGSNLFIESTSGANGENLKVIGGVIADSNNQAGGATELFCINNQLSGNTQISFIGTSIDDCSYYVNQSGGTANESNFTDVHWENPNGQSYPYINMLSAAGSVTVHMKGGDMMNDDTSGLPYFINNGGQVDFNGVTFDANNNVSTPVTRVVLNQNSTNTVSWSGVEMKGAGATYMYGTVPISLQGFGSGADQGPTLVASNFAGSDIGAKVNAAYAYASSSGQTGVTINIPRGVYSFSTPIVCGTAGRRCLITGTPAGGTELDYTGAISTAAITINSGIQDVGIDHTSGNGIYGISLYGNSTSTTTPRVGVFIGGTNGTDGAVLDAVNIYGFGYGLQIGANAYHFLYENGTIRNNGRNVTVNAASNSGESIDFLNAFIVDGASNNALDCIYLDNSSVEAMNYTGGSFDDCQMHILQANNVTITGTQIENPGFTAWGQYTPIIMDNNLATNLNLTGVDFVNDATGSGTSPINFLSGGGNVTANGVNVRQFGGITVTNFAALTGSGRITWSGLNNVSTTAFTNIVSGVPYTPSGFTNQAGAFWSFDANAHLFFNATNTATGTTGNQTINKPTGTVNIAAAGNTVTITDSLVTTASLILSVARTNDSTCSVKNVVPAAGSFAINTTANCTAETSFGFLVVN